MFVSHLVEYVAKLFNTLITTPRKELQNLSKDLLKDVPKPLDTMLPNKDRKIAKEKYIIRKQKTTEICPPTCTGDVTY